MRRLIYISSLALMAIIGIGCATTKGKIERGKYQSPLSNFVIKIPNFSGLKIQDRNDAYGGRVSMHGSFGDLWAITYIRLAGDGSALLNNSPNKDKIYRRFLVDSQMQDLFLRASPSAKLVYEEYISEEENGAFFAVVSIPEGSTLFDAKTDRRLDSLRGLLIFGKSTFMYMLETEMYSLHEQNYSSEPSREQIESAKKTLFEIRRNMTIE